MILLLLGLIGLFITSIVIIVLFKDENTPILCICVFVGIIGAIVSILGLGFYCGLVFEWVSAEHKVKIINNEYGTTYTQSEVFYASDVIDTIREIDRKRIEINGDLIKGE